MCRTRSESPRARADASTSLELGPETRILRKHTSASRAARARRQTFLSIRSYLWTKITNPCHNNSLPRERQDFSSVGCLNPPTKAPSKFHTAAGVAPSPLLSLQGRGGNWPVRRRATPVISETRCLRLPRALPPPLPRGLPLTLLRSPPRPPPEQERPTRLARGRSAHRAHSGGSAR